MKRFRIFKSVILAGLGLLVPLASCSGNAGSSSNEGPSSSIPEVDPFIDVASSYLTLEPNDQATLSFSSSGEVAYRLENADLVMVSENGENAFLVSSHQSNGATYLRIYLADHESLYKDVLIVVGSPSGEQKLGISEGYRTEYYLGETPTFDDVVPYLYIDGSSERTILEKGSYFFNIPTNEPFGQVGEYSVIVTAPDYGYISAMFTITVSSSAYFTLTNSLEKIYEGESYSMSFKTSYGAILDISGIVTKTDHYFVNSYQDDFLIKDDQGIFLARYVYDDNDNYLGIEAHNGYVTSLYGGLSLNNAHDILIGTSSLEGILIEIDEESMLGDRYMVTDYSVLSTIWSDVLGFNGRGNTMYLHTNLDGDIIYTLEGQLSSGVELSFNGSIYDIGHAEEEKIEAYLVSNYSVSNVPDNALSNLVSPFSGDNFTLSSGSTTYVFNENYISRITSSGEDGYVIVDGKIHAYAVSNGVLTLGEEATDMTSLRDYTLHPLHYGAFTTNLGHFYDSSYYGCYVNFCQDDVSEPIDNYFTVQPAYRPLGLALLGVETTSAVRLIMVYRSIITSQIGMSYVQFDDFGSSESAVVENYLGTL